MNSENIITISRMKKLLKYILMTIISAISIKYIPSFEISNKELIMISIVLSIGFTILDIIFPTTQIIN